MGEKAYNRPRIQCGGSVGSAYSVISVPFRDFRSKKHTTAESFSTKNSEEPSMVDYYVVWEIATTECPVYRKVIAALPEYKAPPEAEIMR